MWGMFTVQKGTVCFAVFALLGMNTLAVDVYDGVRAPRGLYALSYSTFYQADDFTDADGDTSVSDFGYESWHETLRLTWYSPDAIFTALVPFGHVEASSFDEEDDGLGDLILAVGRFLPVDSFDLQLLFAAKLPTGHFDSDQQINIGSGQMDLYPALYAHKSSKLYTFDGVMKYFVKLENEDTQVNPGDIFLLEMCGTRQVGPFKMGPQVLWLQGNDAQLDGDTLEDSAKQVFALGGEIYFKMFGISTTLNYVQDIYTENTTQGQLFRMKFCGKF